MEIPQLAAETAKFLSPLLPFLIQGAKDAARAAFDRAGEKFTDEVWEKAETLWGELKSKVDLKQDAIERATRKPEDKRVQEYLRSSLTLQFEDLFSEDSLLAKFVAENVTIENVISIGGNVEYSTIIVGKDNTIINATNYIQGNVYNGPIPRNPQDALKIYRAVIAKMTANLSMRGIDLRASDPSTQKAIKLANVYISLDTTHGSSVLDEVIKNKLLTIKGDPGSGKSTFVNYLTYCLSIKATERLNNWERKKSPFFYL